MTINKWVVVDENKLKVTFDYVYDNKYVSVRRPNAERAFVVRPQGSSPTPMRIANGRPNEQCVRLNVLYIYVFSYFTTLQLYLYTSSL